MADVIAVPPGGFGPQRVSGGTEPLSQITTQIRVTALSTRRMQPMKPGSGSTLSTHFGTMSFTTTVHVPRPCVVEDFNRSQHVYTALCSCAVDGIHAQTVLMTSNCQPIF